MVHIQRSRGYTQRNAFDLATIRKVAETARKANPNAVIFVDNCYGEFTQKQEPLAFGADLIAGSFIKNPGGGITPTGGYIAGRADLVEKCSHRFTAPRHRGGSRLHAGQPARYLPRLLLRARRCVRSAQGRHLCAVPA